jgi:non-ribosomal peptide synthetase component E (peptide arylation enzyme)
VLDAAGDLHVVGRLRQVVNRGGLTLSPAEVEALAEGHPALAEAVCVAVPDEELGERLCVCVVPRAGTPAPTLAELCGWLTDRHGLERHKLPERLVVLDALPLAATGKVCRRTVTALAHACTAAPPTIPAAPAPAPAPAPSAVPAAAPAGGLSARRPPASPRPGPPAPR